MSNQPPQGPQDPYSGQPPQGPQDPYQGQQPQGQPPQGQGGYRDAKAQAKGAKAYAKAQRPWYKKKRFIIPLAFVVLIIAVSVGGSGGDDPNNVATDTGSDSSSSAPDETTEENTAAPAPAEKKKKAPKALAVSAKQILKEFEDNEAAADAKYEGKTIAVTGIVNKIDTEIFNEEEYVVQIADGSDFVYITVNCDDQSNDVAATIKKGQKITATGDFEDGGDLGVEMQGCVLS